MPVDIVDCREVAVDVFFCFLSSLEASRTAIASWSAHEVRRSPQVLPSSFPAICCAVQPSTSLGIALRFPLQPPVNSIFVTTSFSSMSKEIILEHVFFVLYVYLIILPPISFTALLPVSPGSCLKCWYPGIMQLYPPLKCTQ